MKTVISLSILLALSQTFFGQAVCRMTREELPEIHGLRLGSSRRQVERSFVPTPSKTYQINVGDSGARNLEGVWFDFFGDSLAAVEFDYRRETEWKDVRGFAESLERSHKLPLASWVFIDRTEARIECDGFTASISSIRNTLTLKDTFAVSAIQSHAGRSGNQTRERIAGQ